MTDNTEKMDFTQRLSHYIDNNKKALSILSLGLVGAAAFAGGCIGKDSGSNSVNSTNTVSPTGTLSTENPYVNDNIIDYHDYLSASASRPFDYENAINNLPEVYTGVMKPDDVAKYKTLVSKINSKDPDAARWVVGMGQFAEDRKISDDEIAFADVISQDDDPLRALVTPWARDGITSADTDIAKGFSLPAGKYGYLSDDLEKIPAATPAAKEKLESIAKASVNDYELRKAICLMDEYGTPQKGNFKYPVPKHNTQLDVTMNVLDNPKIIQDYYRLAMASGIEYGSIEIIGDEKVLETLPDYVKSMDDFIIETDNIMQQKGATWRVKDYSLEADMALVGSASGTALPISTDNSNVFITKKYDNQASWQNAFTRDKMTPAYFDMVTTSPETLKKMREYMIAKGLPKNIAEFIESDYSGKHYGMTTEEYFKPITVDGMEFYTHSNGDIDRMWNEFQKTGIMKTSFFYNAHGCTLNNDYDRMYVEKALSTSIGIPAEVGSTMKHGKNIREFNFHPVVFYNNGGILQLKPSEARASSEYNKCSTSAKLYEGYEKYLPLNTYVSLLDGSWSNLASDTTVSRIYRDGKDTFDMEPGSNYSPTTEAIKKGIPESYKFRSNFAVITDFLRK